MAASLQTTERPSPVREANSGCKLAAILRISCALALTAASPEDILLKVRRDKVTVSCPDDSILLSGFVPANDIGFFRSVFACEITFS